MGKGLPCAHLQAVDSLADQLRGILLGVEKPEDRRSWVDCSEVQSQGGSSSRWATWSRAFSSTKETAPAMREAGGQAGAAYVLGGRVLVFEIVNEQDFWTV